MMTERANAICILEILKEYSDEKHILAMREIIQKMNSFYDLHPDRRTVYSAISLLMDLGYDISTFDDNGVGYYLRSRDFEPSEILLLTDAVYSFPFIPAHQSEILISKLQKQLSAHTRKEYRHLTIVRQEKKSLNRQVFYTIDVLDEAIQEKRQVSFTYLQYGTDKKLHPRREEPYIVNPYGLVFMNEHYYLVCNYSGRSDTNLYRVDRMNNIDILQSNWDRTFENKENISNAVFAFSGRPESISVRCDKVILDNVLDKFGTDIFIKDINDQQFEFKTTLSPDGFKFWALQYLPYAEVLEPEWLRKEIIESIRSNKYDSED